MQEGYLFFLVTAGYIVTFMSWGKVLTLPANKVLFFLDILT